MFTFFYIFGILLEFIILIFICVYLVSVIYSVIKGSFYVATSQKEVDIFLKEAHLKKGQYMLELGSGDGRTLRTAAEHYGVVGKGIDINPSLNWIAQFWARRKHLKNIQFKTESVFTTDLKKADILYIFLMPRLTERIEHRLGKETKKGVLIISHGFTIDSLKKYQIKMIDRKPFKTYFYQLP